MSFIISLKYIFLILCRVKGITRYLKPFSYLLRLVTPALEYKLQCAHVYRSLKFSDDGAL